jgi:hypothetical protein
VPTTTEAAPADLVERLLGELLGWRRHEPWRRVEEEFDFAEREEADAVEDVGRNSSCQAIETQDEERQDKSCPTSNTTAIITDISDGKGMEADEPCDVTTSPAASCDESSRQTPTAGGANDCEIFSGDSTADAACRGSARNPQPLDATRRQPAVSSATGEAELPNRWSQAQLGTKEAEIGISELATTS